MAAGIEPGPPVTAGGVKGMVGAHLAVVLTEWASTVAVLVYAYQREGTAATGLASLAVLAPQVLAAPAAANLTVRHPPRRVRAAGMVVQAMAFATAAALAVAEAPVAAVVVAVVIALAALGTLRPTGAVLLPAMVGSGAELATANLWVSHAESASALLGPLLAAALLAVGDPGVALAGCALLTVAALVPTLTSTRAVPRPDGHEDDWQPGAALSGALATMRQRPWTAGVLVVVAARSAVVGALDVALVVLAFEELDLGAGGPGWLSALVGLGALASTAVTASVVGRRRLAPALLGGLVLSATACVALALLPALGVALLALPVLGLSIALLYGGGTILLQRAADPRVLGSLFAMIELVGGVGLLVGSGLAQGLIALVDVRAALTGLAVVLVVVLVVSAVPLGRADAGADVPVVEMSVLHALPMFASLPPLELEAVARSAERLEVPGGTVVIRQGDQGDRFYAVVDGAFGIDRDGERIRVAERGSCFGEVALLVDVARTATVSAEGPGVLLAVDREPFLMALTRRGAALAGAWRFVQAMPVAPTLPAEPSVRSPEPGSA